MVKKRVSSWDEISQKMGSPKINHGARAVICKKMGLPHGTPIVDAPDDIDIHVRARDIRSSDPKDPGGCGYVKALCRENGYTNVRVYRNTTLIEGTDNKGRPIIYRYINSPEMRAILRKFDNTGSMFSHNVTLLAPTGAKTMVRDRAVKRVYVEKIRSGEHVPVPNGRQKPDAKNLRPRLLSPEPNLPAPQF